MTVYSTSMNYITTTASGEQFQVDTTFAGSYGSTEAESVAAAIAGYEKAGLTADQLLSIETVAYEDEEQALDKAPQSCYSIYIIKREREIMTNETVFIDAENGGVGVYIGAGNKVGWAKTARTLKYIL